MVLTPLCMVEGQQHSRNDRAIRKSDIYGSVQPVNMKIILRGRHFAISVISIAAASDYLINDIPSLNCFCQDNKIVPLI